jgi:hypothetical protein
MLSRPAIASVLLVLLVRAAVHASERDYMQRGEERLTADYQIKYDRAVRYVLSRAWRKDVVVRMVDIPPFQAEWAVGIARTSSGYQAFEVIASKHIWAELGLGMAAVERKKTDYHTIRPILHERPISDALSARIAVLWRRVLADPRNYGKDPGLYLDTDQFTYHVSFLPRERLTAYVVGWGPRTEQLMNVASALANYAEGAREGELIKAIRKAERKLGI